jgi:hypothetical protein
MSPTFFPRKSAFNRVFAKPFRWTYTGRPLMKAAA